MTTKRNKTKQQATIQTKIMLKLFCHFCDLYHSTPYITVMTGLLLWSNSSASQPQTQPNQSLMAASTQLLTTKKIFFSSCPQRVSSCNWQ